MSEQNRILEGHTDFLSLTNYQLERTQIRNTRVNLPSQQIETAFYHLTRETGS